MENTLENKKKFCGLYWGQEIMENPFFPELGCTRIVTIEKFFTVDTRLNLKSVKSITDHDAIELMKIKLLSTGINEDEIKTIKIESRTSDGFTFIIKYKNWASSREGFVFNGQSNPLSFYDYLRSEGYAIPFMGLSVEKLISYGWVKIIETNGE